MRQSFCWQPRHTEKKGREREKEKAGPQLQARRQVVGNRTQAPRDRVPPIGLVSDTPEPSFCRFGRAEKKWISESYPVEASVVADITSRFGVSPEVDCFATQANKRFDRWWGEDSPEAQDAFAQNWAGPMLWMNPPFSRIGEVVRKIARDGAHAVLVVPDWPRRTWHKEAMRMAMVSLRYPVGNHIFEMPGTRKRPTPWPLRVLLICGHEPRHEPTWLWRRKLHSPGGLKRHLLQPQYKWRVRFAKKDTIHEIPSWGLRLPVPQQSGRGRTPSPPSRPEALRRLDGMGQTPTRSRRRRQAGVPQDQPVHAFSISHRTDPGPPPSGEEAERVVSEWLVSQGNRSDTDEISTEGEEFSSQEREAEVEERNFQERHFFPTPEEDTPPQGTGILVLLKAAEEDDCDLTPRGRHIHRIADKGEERQLLMRVMATHQEGAMYILNILIDTGAQANLIRTGVTTNILVHSAKPLILFTANGARMAGGVKEVTLDLLFGARAYTTGAKLADMVVPARFHEADIQVDAILSYPWLRENRLGVWVHEQALEQHSASKRRVLLENFPGEIPQEEESEGSDEDHEDGFEDQTPPEEEYDTDFDEEISEEEADQRWAQVSQVRAMDLEIPTEAGDSSTSLREDEGALWYIAKQLRRAAGEGTTKEAKAQAAKVRGVVAVPPSEKELDPHVLARIKAIHEDFDGKVLRDKIFPGEQPIRGPLGEGRIELKVGAIAQKQRAIPLTGERRDAMIALVDDWVASGKVERGYSEWSSPAFVVAKKGGKWRGVVDFRKLNEATVGDSHPLPRIEDILVRHGRNTIFSVMDLKDAFHQVPLQKASRPCTCTSTPRGTKQWCVVVMGLKNGVAIFQRVIEYCLEEVADVADPYVDDIIIGTQGTWGPELIAQHDTDTRRVLKALEHHRLVADTKCRWFSPTVVFCGHVLGEGKRRPEPGKLMALEMWEPPGTVTALRGFLGFTNYYSAYIPNYAELAADLMEKLKVGRVEGKKGSRTKVNLGAKEIASFEAIKQTLLSGLSLQTVDPDKPFILRVDASDRAIGAALEQFADPTDGMPTVGDATGRRKTVPVAFCSRKLTPGQVRSWSVREKETYAVILALQKWASWIGLQPVLILTDHKAIEQWATEVLDTPSGPAGRRGRWHEMLSKFNLEVAYVPGKDNVVADALSRWAYPASQAFADISIHGSAEDDAQMEELIATEKAQMMDCRVVHVQDWADIMQARTCVRIETVRASPAPPTQTEASHLEKWEAAKSRVVTTRGKERAMQEAALAPPRVIPRHSPRSTRGRRPAEYPGVHPSEVEELPLPNPQDGSSSSIADLARGEDALHNWECDQEIEELHRWEREQDTQEGEGEDTQEEFFPNTQDFFSDGLPQVAPAANVHQPGESPPRDADPTPQPVEEVVSSEHYPPSEAGEDFFVSDTSSEEEEDPFFSTQPADEPAFSPEFLDEEIPEPDFSQGFLEGNAQFSDFFEEGADELRSEEGGIPADVRPPARDDDAPLATGVDPADNSPPRRVARDPADDDAQPQEDTDPTWPEGACVDPCTSPDANSTTAHARDRPVPGFAVGDAPLPVMDMDWEESYRLCSTWGPILAEVQDASRQVPWPAGFTWELKRLYQNNLLCVPGTLENLIVHEHHLQAGHLGGKRLWRELQRFYIFADPHRAEKGCKRAQAECSICQVCEPSRTPFKVPLEHTPISPHLMDRVAVDLFALPAVTVNGQVFDTVALCVDRQSGWMVATPHLNKGLTAEKVAKDMLKHWDMFGIPSVVKSDNGPHFVGAWWRTICAALGVRTAYSQAYHHQANGRAEVAGQLLMKQISKLNAQAGMSWVELLPRALRYLHDAPGPSGFSPYEIVFGRRRPLAGLPYHPISEAVGGKRFLRQMRLQDEAVADLMNKVQEKRVEAANAKRRHPPAFKIGDHVWYRPERQPGTDKLDVRWKGPCTVLQQVGASSYVVELRPGNRQNAHRTQLKAYVQGSTSGPAVPMYFFSEKGQELDAGIDDWEVQEVVSHRPGPDGQPEFRIRWQGFSPEDDTWEPWRNLFPGSNDLAVEYCRDKGVSLDLARMKPPPREVPVSAPDSPAGDDIPEDSPPVSPEVSSSSDDEEDPTDPPPAPLDQVDQGGEQLTTSGSTRAPSRRPSRPVPLTPQEEVEAAYQAHFHPANTPSRKAHSIFLSPAPPSPAAAEQAVQFCIGIQGFSFQGHSWHQFGTSGGNHRSNHPSPIAHCR